GWVLEPLEDPCQAALAGRSDPARPIARSPLAPGKTPTRALAVAIDETTSGYLVVAGSDDGLVRVLSFSRERAGAQPWSFCRWQRVNDRTPTVVLGPHQFIDATGTDAAPEPSDKILFSCYVGTASGDIFALPIERGVDASANTAA